MAKSKYRKPIKRKPTKERDESPRPTEPTKKAKKTGYKKSLFQVRNLSTKAIFILVIVAGAAIIIPIVVIFLASNVNSGMMVVEVDQAHYTLNDTFGNKLRINKTSTIISVAARGTYVAVDVYDDFPSGTATGPSSVRDFYGNSINLNQQFFLDEVEYNDVIVSDVIWDAARRRSERLEYPSSLEWTYDIEGTSYLSVIDTAYPSLTKFISNDIDVTPYSSQHTLTQANEEINVKVHFKVGDDLSALADNKMDSLRISLVFNNLTHENISYRSPIPINGSAWIEENTVSFYKTQYELDEHNMIDLEFNITIISTGNYTDVNLLANNDNIVAQCHAILLQDVYTSMSFAPLVFNLAGKPSDVQQRAYNARSYQNAMNFVIKIPFEFSYNG